MSFSANLKKFGNETTKKLELVREGVLLKLFRAVTYDTPVDTGRLRGNWQTNVGSPKTEQIERTGKQSGSAVMKEAQENLGEFGDTVHFTNNMHYAHEIEFDGKSHTKAPEGMMTKNVLRFQRLLKQEVRKRR